MRNSGHLGRVGDWAEMAAAEGLVSVHFVTAAGSLLVAPYGGVEKRLSTAPYCVGIPRQGQDPIVLDFATSIVAEGKVLVSSRGGKKLPKGALIDADGTLSEDPHVLYGPYTADGPRDHTQGYGRDPRLRRAQGLGAGLHLRIARRRADRDRRDRARSAVRQRHARVLHRPQGRSTPANFFDGEISRYVDFIRATKPIVAGETVMIPGDVERKTRAERTKNGIPLPDDTWAAIVNTAREVGVSEASIQRATQ